MGRTPQGTNMGTTRTIELCSAGGSACEGTVTVVKPLACPSCDITVLDMKHPQAASRAKSLDIRSLPAVVINGALADRRAGRGPDQRA
jgi:glutaredoxin 3